jgi:hypothetical protein
MAKTYAPILITDTFQDWLDRTNLLTDELANWIVTTDTTIAGGETNGNASINGNLDAFMMSTPIIRGGTNVAGTALSIDSNATANFDFTVNQDLTVLGDTVFANVAVTNLTASANVNALDLYVTNQATWLVPAVGDITGNANTATALQTPRKIEVTGFVTGNTMFDGTGDVVINTTSDAATTFADILLVDGAGSGLDADLLDGIDSTQFLRSDQSDTMNGTLTTTGNIVTSGIDVDGILSLDTVGADAYITSSGNAYISAGGNQFEFSSAGNFTSPGDITAFSDRRLKSDIKTIDGALHKVKSLRGVEYIKEGKPSVGLIAQEVEEVFPELVHTNHVGMKSVAYGNLVGVLIESIKQLEKRVQQLEKSK